MSHSISASHSEGFRKSSRLAPHADLAINTHSQLKVAVNTAHEQYMTGQSATIGAEGHSRDKPHKAGIHEDAEGNVCSEFSNVNSHLGTHD